MTEQDIRNWMYEVQQAVKDFLQVSKLAGYPLSESDLEIEFCPAPHTPPKSLPPGKMAVYGFCFNNMWLKIGRAGPKSGARYTSQHYKPSSARSNLAKSLTADPEMHIPPDTVSEWITTNCHRVNVLLDEGYQLGLLRLLEAFLHAKFRPKYEGG